MNQANYGHCDFHDDHDEDGDDQHDGDDQQDHFEDEVWCLLWPG